jgi:hypothetical protein
MTRSISCTRSWRAGQWRLLDPRTLFGVDPWSYFSMLLLTEVSLRRACTVNAAANGLELRVACKQSQGFNVSPPMFEAPKDQKRDVEYPSK